MPQATIHKPKSSCIQGCPKIIKQVCGSDNVTYDNTCLLGKTACEKNKEITVVENGRCQGMSLDLEVSESFQTSHGSLPAISPPFCNYLKKDGKPAQDVVCFKKI